MPATKITGSVNIAVLDSLLRANLCLGKFFVDITPSTFINGGEANILGAKVKIENPFNVAVKDYTIAYDIAAPFTDIYEFSIPTQAGNFQYGKYTISVQITDADNKTYLVKKVIEICPPDVTNKTKKYGTVSAKLRGVCRDGKLFVSVGTPPPYRGKFVSGTEQEVTLTFPSDSLDEIVTTHSSFSVQLFEGEYRLKGEICAEYSYGDNIFYNVLYKVNTTKNIKCSVDECCVFEKLEEMHKSIQRDCSDEDKEHTYMMSMQALRLLKTAQLAEQCGGDPTEYITELEKLLGCQCTCGCSGNEPVINSTPAEDVSIQGCNVGVEVVGNTTIYTIDNHSYVIEVAENGGALVVSAPFAGEDCQIKQTITFNVATVYTQIKNIITNNINDEDDFWANVINNYLGIQGETLKEKIDRIFENLAECCECIAEILSHTSEKVSGNSMKLSWTQSNAFYVDVYIDNVYITTVLSPLNYVIIDEAADGNEHEYSLIARCENGKAATPVTGTFNEFGCPFVAPLTVNSQNVTNASCPFDLDSLIAVDPPIGSTVEWYNNENRTSLVSNPMGVSTGIYYGFVRNGDGCYSAPTQVRIVCQTGSCTEPQNLTVKAATGGFLVQFQGAAFPPPSNSYTVKRRLKSDPDVSGSYTTIGTPAYNSSSSRWEILDVSALDNTEYVYIAISNCGASQPYTSFEFANYTTCPVVTGVVVTIS